MNRQREAILWGAAITASIALGLIVVWAAIALAFSQPVPVTLYFVAVPYRQDDYSAEGADIARLNPLDPSLEQESILEDEARDKLLLNVTPLKVASISDLSADPKYTIKSVCAQTGIRAVTLRAWEQRYNLLEPHRTNGNYRLYSDRDVAVLRWLKRQVDSGLSISSAAAALLEMRRAGMLPESLLVSEIGGAAKTATPTAQFASRLYQAMIKLDEDSAVSILNEAQAVFDLTTVCVEVLTPCMAEIGDAWHRQEISVVAEHFATGYIRGRLTTLLQSFPTQRGAPRIAVGCAPNERHDVGGLMVSVLLRRDGFRVDFLGADVPIDDIVIYARAEKPAMICLSAATVEATRDLKRLHQMLSYLKPAPRFGFGGRAFNINPALRASIPGTFLGESAAEACVMVRQLLA